MSDSRRLLRTLSPESCWPSFFREAVIRRCVLVIVALFAFTGVSADDARDKTDKAIKQEQEKLQSKWKIVRQEFSGAVTKEVSDEPDEIKGDKWLRPKRKTAEYGLKLDPTKDPKQVDLTAERLANKTLKGIYKLDGDKLTICYAYDPDQARPTEFKTKRGDKCYLYELERVKKN